MSVFSEVSQQSKTTNCQTCYWNFFFSFRCCRHYRWDP